MGHNGNFQSNTFNCLICVLLGMVMLLSAQTVHAEQEQTGGSIGVTAVFPKNQTDKKLSYFDLVLKPNESQEIEVELTNFSDKDVIVTLATNPATTNNNGAVDYSHPASVQDSTLLYSFSDLSSVAKEVKIPKYQTIRTKIKIQMPKKAFKGVVAGGIYIAEKEVATKAASGSETTINNTFSYSMAVLLRNTVKAATISPELVLDETKVKAIGLNYQEGIVLNIQNSVPIFIKDLEIKVDITDLENQEVVHQATMTKVKMAPNSNFDFNMEWANSLKDSNYQADIKVKLPSSEKQWKWQVPFTVKSRFTPDDSSQTTQEVPEEKDSQIQLGYVVSIALLIFIFIGIIIFFIKVKL